ncbi:sensor histidine kinase [Cyclobacterium xiamenense]|uniref:sensor histidine kinase n=1 Tax=Cyclobacterium xiamenense TaxID=1297121 RepID=UPI0035CF5B50
MDTARPLSKKKVDFFDSLEGDKKLVVIRMVQECLNNAIKHASPQLISIHLVEEGGIPTLLIRDDGVGFDTHSESSGLGIKNLKSRIKAINGQVDVVSGPNKGTQIKIQLENAIYANNDT